LTTIRKKLIEVAMPLDAINAAAAREKSIRHGHPSTLHLWWARRPLAACRAVLFGQLVDDPSSWPDLFPTEEAQNAERQRLFRIIEQMVPWEASNDERIIGAARLEVARSIARGRVADGLGDERDKAVLKIQPVIAGSAIGTSDGNDSTDPARTSIVNSYLAEVAPPIHDPFAGGGSIPLEAQRLGLRAIATDLNPVAVLINKALIEIPPKFAGLPPVNPESRSKPENATRTWKGAQGLAEDVRYYGKWMRDEAFKRIGHLYPPVRVTEEMTVDRPDLQQYVGQDLTVIAWLWARTVASPNPACGGAHVPLVSSFWMSKKPGKEAWIEPVVDRANNQWRFEVRTGKPIDTKSVDAGTKTGRGTFQCILSGDVISSGYVQEEGKNGRIQDRLIAIVGEGTRGRVYLSAGIEDESVARVGLPGWVPDFEFAKNSRHMTPCVYGLDRFDKLFTPRQLTALVTFSDLVSEARERVLADAASAGMEEGASLESGGVGAIAYADAVAVYCGLCSSRSADYWASLCIWAGDFVAHVFGRNALSMVMDFAETNVFSDSTGNWMGAVEWVARVIDGVPAECSATVDQRDATNPEINCGQVTSSDPPYYDNVPYADLSDYFYVWLRRSLRPVLSQIFSTVLVPKAPELIAEPFRHGGASAAEAFFLDGMTKAIGRMREALPDEYPAAIYYAFKQSETSGDATSSTGWETFIQAVIDAGFYIDGTWPVRTERPGRLRETGSNALASSIVLVCRKKPTQADVITRTDFRRMLRTELAPAIKTLQRGNIQPADMPQASIGPGMAIFSRYAKVLESDGSAMTVRTALQMINQALDEFQDELVGEMDSDTRFALTWFDSFGFDVGQFGRAEDIAKARNVSVAGVAEAGIIHAAAGKVRLIRRGELPEDWDPETDRRLTIWEATQHLIKRLETKGEQAAADLMARLGTRAAPARDLAFRLYTTCERKGWAEEGRSYNGLAAAWPELEKLASGVRMTGPSQGDLL